MTGVDAIKATVDELIKALSARNIMGEPIETEDKIIIPITKMGMGFGTGQGREDASKGVLTIGAGGGVGVFPVAVVIVFKGIPGIEGVKVIPLSGQSAITEPVTSLADNIIEKVARYWESREKKPSRTAAVDVE
jgi:uncharacterized spore protein YtfJ